MDPLTTTTSVLTSIKTATDIAKLLKNADTSLEKAELKLKLAELIEALAEAKLQTANIKEGISEKNKTIKELEGKLNLQSTMQFQKPFYWCIEGEKKDGPFCPQCWDNNKKKIRLKDYRNGCWSCLTCNNSFRDDSFNPQQNHNPYNNRITRRTF